MRDENRDDLHPSSAVRHPSSLIHHPSSFIAGIAAALSLAVLGNLGTVRMIYQGYQRLAAPGGAIEGANILTRLIWAARGALMTLAGDGLPYALRDWYWLPSRAIPAPNDVEPITEFPFFTVLYGDPHAHLFALPLTLLALSWALSVVLSRAWKPDENSTKRRSILQICVSIFLGGLAIGALWPTNTWDYPTFLGLGVLGAGYAIWRQYRPLSERKSQAERGVNSPGESEVEAIDGPAKASTPNLPVETKRILLVLGGALSLAAVSFILYRPYSEWYVQGYTDVGIWKGTHTPFWSYLTHWGAFLFLILSWMIWETREWMANTPLSTLRKLEPYKGLLSTTGILLLLLIVVLQLLGAAITWFVLPIAVWAMILLIRPGMPVEKRAVLVMVALSLVLTLSVEVVVLVGDIGRMNTVFKFYLQVWTMFSLSAALSFSWLLAASVRWLPAWKTTWQAVVLVLVFATGLYPLLGSLAKIRDRMSLEAPHTLDGMAYMRYSRYDDLGVNMDLSQDYRAIKWFQENIPGSPVIIEGNMVEYHWGTRFTIYTGLPNVIGWNWHQRQQRARAPEYVIPERLNDVTEFYTTTVPDRARKILEKYQVEYVIVGQLEKALYSGQGLDKFEQLDGAFWREVYRDGETVIYQVTG
jgi:YYY domain-containing protein